MRILSAEAMREVDRAAIEEYGIPSMVLMENAAVGVADAIGERFAEVERVVIFCGPGNNGGDGLAVGRHLAIRGYDVRIFVVAGGHELQGDAGAQLGICRKQGLAITEAGAGEGIDELVAEAAASELVIDALFGTGLSRPLEGQPAALVAALGRLPVPRVAVDLPSGLSGSRSDLLGPYLRADLTVTFAAPKIAHIFPPAAEAVGDLVITDLGIPRRLLEEAPGGLNLLLAEELVAALAPRPAASHKGDYGHVLLLAGAPGKAGAAVLAARAAVRSGAGLVTVAVPEPILSVVDLGSLESMTLPLEVDPAGGLAPAAAEAVLTAARDKRVLAVGPGLGLDDGTVAVVRRLVAEAGLTLVVDADGLNAFAGEGEKLAARRGPAILTPHPGELARLIGGSSQEIQSDRVAAARRAAEEMAAVVVLKGHQTLIAEPGGEIYVNPTGNPGMASGGSGDVLLGMVAGLAAQHDDPVLAATLAVYVHGLAGDLAAEEVGEVPLRAGDVLEALPDAFGRLAGA